MARPITADIPHDLGKDEARRRLAEGFGRIGNQLTGGTAGLLAMKERWEGDRLYFDASGLGQTMTGRIEVRAESVHLEIDLPDFLAAIAEVIKGKVTTETRLLLEKK